MVRKKPWLRCLALTLAVCLGLIGLAQAAQDSDVNLGGSGAMHEDKSWLGISEKWEEIDKSPNVGYSDDDSLGLSLGFSVMLRGMSNNDPHAIEIEKTAKVLGTGNTDSGLPDNPVPVQGGDQIEYTLRVKSNEEEATPPRYDVLFVLDWSASMYESYPGGGERARILAKNTVLNLSAHVLEKYEGSRVAVMGMNGCLQGRNSNNVKSTNIQIETDFVGIEGYDSTISNAYSSEPMFNYDDNATFLRAAVEKMGKVYSNSPITYGGITDSTSGNYVPQKKVIPRIDKSRTPVIVMISDFQDLKKADDSPSQMWPGMKQCASDFLREFPDGIFLTVRTDHSENVAFNHNSAAMNQKMQEIIDLGEGRWDWTKQTLPDQDTELEKMIDGKIMLTELPLTVTDALSDKVNLISSSPAPTTNEDGTLIWNFDDIAPGEEKTITITAEVVAEGLIVNQAQMKVNGDPEVNSDPTYHLATFTPEGLPGFGLEKTAKVLPAGSEEIGTSENPVPVEVGDYIEYTLNLAMEDPKLVKKQYDVLYLLDFSGSMAVSFSDSSDKALDVVKDVIKDTSHRILQEYTGSRVAVMGLNSSGYWRNMNDPRSTYLQVDSDFVGLEDYESVIEHAFDGQYVHDYDDCPTFLRAAYDKIRGYEGQPYGGDKNVDVKYVNGRKDMSRTPVIIMISDFQDNPNDSQSSPDFWASMEHWAGEYHRDFPDGIFIAVRADHSRNEQMGWNSDMHNAKQDNLAAVGGATVIGPRWGWMKFAAGDGGYQQRLDNLWDLIVEKAPSHVYSATVTDVLSEKLSFDSSVPAPDYSNVESDGKTTLHWDLTGLEKDVSKTITIKVKVEEEGVIPNFAAAVVETVPTTMVNSNHTFHEALSTATLFIRQIVLHRGSSPLPEMGYASLSTTGVNRLNVTMPSSENAVAEDFAEYLVKKNTAGYRVESVIPQHYTYVGYYVADSSYGAVPSGSILSGIPDVTFSSGNTIYLTLYIQATDRTPGEFHWGVRTNDFGTITNPA